MSNAGNYIVYFTIFVIATHLVIFKDVSMKKLLILFLLISAVATAQPFGGIRTPNDTLQSVRILPGNPVTLSIYAPKASEVTVIGDFLNELKPLSLVKAENGVWTVSIPGVTPGVYTYDFTVDGVRTFDPRNAHYKESENGLSNIFELPGKEAEFCMIKNVPHGKVEIVWFASPVLNNTGRMHVYTPPGYENMKSKLPVLYLQHGGGDNDASWTTVGKANVILDNLLAEGKIKPMVVVMAMGHPAPGFHMLPGVDDDAFYRQLFNDIMPYVESHYNVSNKRGDRAFAGLSMGGIQALNIALFAPEKFGYVLPLSTGYFPEQLKMLEEKYSPALKNPEINNLKLFWIAMVGEKDIAYQNGKNVLALFDKYGIRYQTNDFPAGHTFITWRHNLYEFAPLLFK
jgi:enterochelin esterase family protein